MQVGACREEEQGVYSQVQHLPARPEPCPRTLSTPLPPRIFPSETISGFWGGSSAIRSASRRASLSIDIVERIRQTSIRFHREEDEGAQRELQTTLNSLSRGRTNQIIRAYSYFSHLSNLAEDQHHVRRSRAHMMAKSGPRPGTIANALKAAQEAGVKQADLAAFFASALVSPVLTAHPTEVRRKSTIDREMEVSQILAHARPPASHPRRIVGQ